MFRNIHIISIIFISCAFHFLPLLRAGSSDGDFVSESRDFNSTNGTCDDLNKTLTNCFIRKFKYSDQNLFVNDTLNLTVNGTVYVFANNSVTICETFDPCYVRNECYLPCIFYLGWFIMNACFLYGLGLLRLVVDMRGLLQWGIHIIRVSMLFFVLILCVPHWDQISDDEFSVFNISVLINFYLLATYTWMSILTSDAFLTYSGCFKYMSRLNGRCVLTGFPNIGYIAPLIAVLSYGATGFLSTMLLKLPVPEFEQFCWLNNLKPSFLYLIAPVILLGVFNLMAFGVSIYTFKYIKWNPELDSGLLRLLLREIHWSYWEITLLPNAAFIAGAVSTHWSINWLWYISLSLNFFVIFATLFRATYRLNKCSSMFQLTDKYPIM